MASIFTKIINKEIPSFRIAENEMFLAFLDIMPLREGHTLIVPKIEVDKIYELPDDYLAQLLMFAKPIAKAIEKSFLCQRVGMAVIGIEVAHAHLHLVPIDNADDINFTNPKLKPTQEDLLNTQTKILETLANK